MKKQITSLSPLQNAKVVSFIYFIITALIFIPIGIFSLISGKTEEGLAFFLFPLMYLILIFLAILIFCVIFNFIVKWTGGIEYTSSNRE